tara:strand:- start:1218 stop:1529 length:312 start_codon:yes stop_codon:yes gene_type:complete
LIPSQSIAFGAILSHTPSTFQNSEGAAAHFTVPLLSLDRDSGFLPVFVVGDSLPLLPANPTENPSATLARLYYLSRTSLALVLPDYLFPRFSLQLPIGDPALL